MSKEEKKSTDKSSNKKPLGIPTVNNNPSDSPPISDNDAQVTQKDQSLEGNRDIVHAFIIDPKSKSPLEFKKPLFLKAYYDQFTVTHTCGAIGIARRTFYAWMEDDKNFNKAFNIVERSITERMMRTAMARGIRGSDNLLMFMLKYRDPSFRDKAIAELDPKTVDKLVNTFVDALRKTVPDSCPNCHHNLNLTPRISKMLQSLSKPLTT